MCSLTAFNLKFVLAIVCMPGLKDLLLHALNLPSFFIKHDCMVVSLIFSGQTQETINFAQQLLL